MNELSISIIDPYSGEETLPVFEKDSDREKYIYEPMMCTEPFVFNIQKYAFNNEKGYRFFTQPCLCYRALPKSFETHSDDLKEVLYNEKTKNFVKRILTKDYTLCSKCPSYKANNEGYSKWASGYTILHERGFYGKQMFEALRTGKINKTLEYPYCVNVSLDTRCNLICPTCRDGQVENGGDLTDEDFITLVDFLSKCKCIAIGSDGETFVCKTYLKLLEHDFSNTNVEKIIIYTNGTLFDEKAWNKIHPNNRNLVAEVKISLDATTKETYDKVRNGKYWDRVMKNIDFLNGIPNKKFLLHSTFTISKTNYLEAIDFVDFAMSKGFTHILFSFARPVLHEENGNNDFILDDRTKQELTNLISEISENKNNFEKDIFVGLI